MITVKDKHSYKGAGEYIGRPSVLGNPFSHLNGTLAMFHTETRQGSVDAYLVWLREQYLHNPAVKAELVRLANIAKAGDLVLICWCAPLPCHGDVLKAAIEQLIAKKVV